MIKVSVNLGEQQVWMMLFDGFNPSQQEDLNDRVNKLTSVFSRKHQMVVTDEYSVRRAAVDSWHQVL